MSHHRRGSRHQNAKFNDRDILAIRAEYGSGDVRMQQLADRHGVTVSNISRVISGETWTHLPINPKEAATALALLEEVK